MAPSVSVLQWTAKQSVFLRIQVRASSQTKGLERGREQTFFPLASHALRACEARHALPISLLILRRKPTVLQSSITGI